MPYTAGERTIGSVYFDKLFSLLTVQTDKFLLCQFFFYASFLTSVLVIEKIGKVALTDEQIKLASSKLVNENLFVSKGLKTTTTRICYDITKVYSKRKRKFFCSALSS